MKIVLSIIFITISVSSLFAQEKYINRDSEEWNQLTVAQRWEAVNIPEAELRSMTTLALIEHCLNFNFMYDIFNALDYNSGLNNIIIKHNGLRELLNRNDSGKFLLSYYKNIDLNKITKISEPVTRGEFSAKIFFLELFLSYSNILNQFKGNEKELIKSILKTYDSCLEINTKTRKNYYSGYSIGTKVLVIGKTLNNLENKTTDDPAIRNMDLSKLSNEKLEKIIEKARKI